MILIIIVAFWYHEFNGITFFFEFSVGKRAVSTWYSLLGLWWWSLRGGRSKEYKRKHLGEGIQL